MKLSNDLTIQNTAQELTKCGIKVLRIAPGGKNPVDRNWPNTKIDIDAIDTYFKDNDNLGIILGESSNGLVDVDIDHPLCKKFADWLPKTELMHGRKSNPKSHYWYSIFNNLQKSVKFSTNANGCLIELRSSGGQTVIPPSSYMQDDGALEKLEWNNAGQAGKVDWETLLKAVSKIASATLLALHWPKTGSRHNASLALAGALLRNGWTAQDAEDFIEKVAEAANDEESSSRASNVKSTFDRILSNRTTKGIPSLQEYISPEVVDKICQWLDLGGTDQEWPEPILFEEVKLEDISASLLPSPYREFAQELAASAEVPEALPILSIFSIVSTAIAKKYAVTPKAGWVESINLYVLVALPPANNKSLILNSCRAPLDSWEFQESLKVEPKRDKALSDQKILELQIDKLERDIAKENDPIKKATLESNLQILQVLYRNTKVPALPKLYVNDITPEALADQVFEQDGRMAILSDEGGFFEVISGLYTNGKANNDIILKGIDGGVVRIERKQRSVQVNPHLTIAIIAQPQVLRNIGKQKALQGKGIPERFLYAIPPSMLGRRKLSNKSLSKIVQNNYEDQIKKLLDIPLPKDNLGLSLPTLLPLSNEALLIWQNWRHEIEPMLAPEGELSTCLGWGGKLAGTTLRLAGLLELMQSNQGAREITEISMERAIGIAKAAIPHALAAFSVMTESDPIEQLAQKLVQKIRAKGLTQFSLTEVYKIYRCSVSKIENDKVLGLLEHRNIIRELNLKTTLGKKMTKIYELNPRIFDNPIDAKGV